MSRYSTATTRKLRRTWWNLSTRDRQDVALTAALALLAILTTLLGA